MGVLSMRMIADEEKVYYDRYQEVTEAWVKATQNCVNLSQVTYHGDPKVWKILDYVDCIKIFACIVLVIGGLLGNISVILTVTLRKSMRNSINIYIANLAVADAVTCITCALPFTLDVMTNVRVLGDFICKIEDFILVLCLTSSVLFLAVISYDRFVAVLFPLRVRFTKQHPWLPTAIVWIVSIVIAIPILVLKNDRTVEWKNFLETRYFSNSQYEWHYDELLDDCVLHRPLATVYLLVITVVFFFLPLLIMIIAYSFILWKVWTTEAPGEKDAANFKADSQSRKKVNTMIFVVLLAFMICWMPYQVLVFYVQFGFKITTDFQFPKWVPGFLWFAEYMTYANSFVNPIIYGILNKNFRKELCTILPCTYLIHKRKRSGRSRTSERAVVE